MLCDAAVPAVFMPATQQPSCHAYQYVVSTCLYHPPPSGKSTGKVQKTRGHRRSLCWGAHPRVALSSRTPQAELTQPTCCRPHKIAAIHRCMETARCPRTIKEEFGVMPAVCLSKGSMNRTSSSDMPTNVHNGMGKSQHPMRNDAWPSGSGKRCVAKRLEQP